MEQCRDHLWVECMEQAIRRCAPHVVQALASAGALDPTDPDHPLLVGELILEVATRACAEDWPEGDLPRESARLTRGWLLEAGRLPSPTLAGHDPAPVREAARLVIADLPVAPRRVVELLVDGFSAPEVAVALGCEVPWVEACWDEAVAAIRGHLERVCTH